MASAYDGALRVESTEKPMKYLDARELKLSETPEFRSTYSPMVFERYDGTPKSGVCAISRDGKYCAFYTSHDVEPQWMNMTECKIFILNIDSKDIIEMFSFQKNNSGVKELHFSPYSKYLMCNLYDSVIVLNVKTRKVVVTKNVSRNHDVLKSVVGIYSNRVIFAAANGRDILTINGNREYATDSFFIYDAPSITLVGKSEKKIIACRTKTHGVYISGNASVVGCLSLPINAETPFEGSNGTARQFTVFNPDTLREMSSFLVPVGTYEVSMTSFGTQMVNYDHSSQFCYLWDVLAGTRLKRLPTLLYSGIVFTPNLKFYIEPGLNTVFTYEISTGRLVSREKITPDGENIHKTDISVSGDFGRAALIVDGKLAIISPKIGMLNRAVTVALCQSKRKLYLPVELLHLIVDKFV